MRVLRIDTVFYACRGNAYYSTRKYEEAINDYNEAIKRGTKKPEVYIRRGDIRRQRKEYEEAIEDYKQALQYDPANTLAYNNLGIAYLKIGEHDKAIQNLTAAIKLGSDNAVLYLNRGSIYEDKKENDEAIKDYDSAVRLCPNYKSNFVDTNFAHGKKEFVEKARDLLDETMRRHPKGSADYHYYSGVWWLFTGDRLIARRRFTIASRKGCGQEGLVRHLENLRDEE